MPHFLEGLPLSEWDMKVEMRNVYSFPCFHPQFMSMINEEIQNFQEVAEKLSISYRKPNTMNNFGVILNDIGMKDVLSDFQRRFILPLSRCLYPEEGEYLHDHHSFIVQYCAEGDKGLGMHKDDSEVTLNVCLGHDFTGALLRFGRTSLVPSIRDQPLLLYQHEVGRGLLHLGNQLHGAEDIASGERVNLIIWSKNNKWRNF
uniref:Fe2OG dioxygenase domain-containing protein n=1 Tax=Chromera velia CCMP2878 TaxID=1169474 RepID=A0A0G4H3D6_9ALVE|eukprot:Cvel_5631.t1-p1 / transcript=Cvel_5631.t1 / gene=Cvel_5631 / organism=Chromera_velia_CCMP2878 / gene_product=2-oxoglutarate and iron-dependent oxygenase, putative / transcript_product=2-oxoglutarate and iron-dependent oxygenase, putative / location=Cvel_scaffold265:73862-74464(-) / protein_length=201 / sequence_SO=supercontig / SO=protein_coding / is_pseudo=false